MLGVPDNPVAFFEHKKAVDPVKAPFHDAVAIPGMVQTEGMAQFVQTRAEAGGEVGPKRPQRSFEWGCGTEKIHKMLFEKAGDAVNGGSDVHLCPVQICQVCGYTLEGDAPEACPLCGAEKDKFVAFEGPQVQAV